MRKFIIEEAYDDNAGLEGYRLLEEKKFLGLFKYTTDDIKITFGHSIKYFSNHKSSVESVKENFENNKIELLKLKFG